jgi:hypothetical protein
VCLTQFNDPEMNACSGQGECVFPPACQTWELALATTAPNSLRVCKISCFNIRCVILCLIINTGNEENQMMTTMLVLQTHLNIIYIYDLH